MEHFIGIDLGTTYSAVSTIDEYGKPVILKNADGEHLTPSVVYFDPHGNAIAGAEAKEMMLSGEDNVIMFFKREMGNPEFAFHVNGKSYSATDLSAILLRKLKSDAELSLGASVTKAVITVPAYFNDLQRNETIKAAQMAGLEVLRIINEPTAAAINYGIARDVDQKLLVYDLGGGTFDVTVLAIKNGAITVLATGGDHSLGGKDWDDCIISYITDQFVREFGDDPNDDPMTYNDLAFNAEKLKKQLSSVQSASMLVRYAGHRQKYEITREKFEELTASLLQSTKDKTEEVLREAGLTWHDLSGALLVGGSTKMPMVEKWVRAMSGKEPLRGINVDEAVCLGAAIQASLELSSQCVRRGLPQGSVRTLSLPAGVSIKVNDVMSHSLGAIAVSQDGDRYVNSIIIRKNLTIPISESRSFKHKTRRNSDNEMEVYLTQGEGTEVNECTVVGRYMIKDIQHVESGESIIDLHYSYDENGVINISGYQQETKKHLVAEKLPLPDDMSWLYEKPKGKAMPLNLIIAIDLSGSMGGRPMKQARNAALEFVSKIDLSVHCVGIMGFSDDAKMFSELTHDAYLVQSAIDRLDCNAMGVGYGNDNNPLQNAIEIFDRRRDFKNILIILTDGVWSSQRKAIKSSDYCREVGYDVIAIGFGGADKKFLQRISTNSESALLTNLDDLIDSFGSIAQEISQSGGTTSIKWGK